MNQRPNRCWGYVIDPLPRLVLTLHVSSERMMAHRIHHSEPFILAMKVMITLRTYTAVAMVFLVLPAYAQSPRPSHSKSIADELKQFTRRQLARPNRFLLDLPLSVIYENDSDSHTITTISPYGWIGREYLEDQLNVGSHGKELFFTLGGVRRERLGVRENSVYEFALEKEFHIELLRMFLPKLSKQAGFSESPWEARLQDADRLILQTLEDAETKSVNLSDLLRERRLKFESLVQDISGDIKLVANKSGLESRYSFSINELRLNLIEEKRFESSNNWGLNDNRPELPKVTISTQPDKGSVEYMTVYNHWLCFEASPRPTLPLNCDWISQTSNPLEIGGEYWFRVTWPNKRTYKEKKQPEIIKSTTLTFIPDP